MTGTSWRATRLGLRPDNHGPGTWHGAWLIVVASLALASLACNLSGFGGETNQRNNAVRRAALNYEIDTRGPADELLVDFGLLEWRDDLGFAAGRTVWLSPVARDEFLVERNPECTYIYLHAPIEAGETATIEVTRGGPTATTSHRLTLYASAGAWQVVGDEPLQ